MNVQKIFHDKWQIASFSDSVSPGGGNVKYWGKKGETVVTNYNEVVSLAYR